MEKYFLYLDILGFAEMAKTPHRVLDLYQIIDNLNVHKHDVFRSIIFSDTMLVYNLAQPKTSYDHTYLVMFLAEFAQDLLYRLIGREYYFRAILTKGEFRHEEFKKLEAFFGAALIESFNDEKNLIGCGLFMNRCLLTTNDIFPTCKHCEKYDFVFLTQDIERIHPGKEGFPIDGHSIQSTGMENPTYAQLLYLKDIYAKGTTHPLPKVRAKFQGTWTFYSLKYPELCRALLESNFDFSAVIKIDWQPAKEAFEKELASDYYKYKGSLL